MQVLKKHSHLGVDKNIENNLAQPLGWPVEQRQIPMFNLYKAFHREIKYHQAVISNEADVLEIFNRLGHFSNYVGIILVYVDSHPSLKKFLYCINLLLTVEFISQHFILKVSDHFLMTVSDAIYESKHMALGHR